MHSLLPLLFRLVPLSSLFVGLFLFLSLCVTVAFALLRPFVADRGVRCRRWRLRRRVRSAGVTTLELALAEVPLEGDHLLQSSLHLLLHPLLDPIRAALPPIATTAARARCCWHRIEVLLRVAVLRFLLGLGHHSFFLFVVVVVVIAVVFVCSAEVEVHPLDDVALPRGKRYVQRRHTAAGGPSREQELFDRVRKQRVRSPLHRAASLDSQ